ncbi:MAG: hypothetical protein K1060chlam1_00243 [Candidatus Anoxychlamydiales bacterium]|nr:hypothetical protein [Candidatus Anoxychlamydiales bacterium]
MSSQPLGGMSDSNNLYGQDNSQDPSNQQLQRGIAEVTNPIFAYLEKNLSKTLHESNPLRERTEDEQARFGRELRSSFESGPLSSSDTKLSEELKRVSHKYERAQEEFGLDPLQIAIADLSRENDDVTKKAINQYIAEHIKFLASNCSQTELTKKINNGKLDEARKYISEIPEAHRRAFFQIAEKIGPELKEGFRWTILHSALVLDDTDLIAEIFDKLKDLPQEKFKEFLECRGSFFAFNKVVYTDVLSLSLHSKSLKTFNKLIENFPEDILVDLIGSLKVFSIAFLEQDEEKLAERLKKLKIVIEKFSGFSSDLQKKCIPPDTLLKIIEKVLPKGTVATLSFSDNIKQLLQIVKDDGLKKALLSARTSSNKSLLELAIEQKNEKLALVILSAINNLKEDDKNECLSFELLAFAAEAQMKSLVRELLKTIRQDLKHKYLKGRILYDKPSPSFAFDAKKIRYTRSALELAIEQKDEEMAILIFNEILKLDLEDKRHCIRSNLLYKALRYNMLDFAKLILNSIKTGENSLEKSVFIEFLQYSNEKKSDFLLKANVRKVLQLALKNKYEEISQIILKRIQTLNINDQIKCLFHDHDLFQYFCWMKKSRLLKEITDNILKKASQEGIAKVFNEEGINVKCLFLKQFINNSEDESNFITFFKMIPNDYIHRYLNFILLKTAIVQKRNIIAHELISIIKSFNDNDQKAKILYEKLTSVLFELIKNRDVDLIKGVLSVFEECPDEQWKLLSFSNSIKTTALHYVVRLKNASQRKAIIKMLLEATPKERRLEFLQMEGNRKKESVLFMLKDDELKEYVYPLLSKEEKEGISAKKKSKKDDSKFPKASVPSSSASSSSSSSQASPKKKPRLKGPEDPQFQPSSSSRDPSSYSRSDRKRKR